MPTMVDNRGKLTLCSLSRTFLHTSASSTAWMAGVSSPESYIVLVTVYADKAQGQSNRVSISYLLLDVKNGNVRRDGNLSP